MDGGQQVTVIQPVSDIIGIDPNHVVDGEQLEMFTARRLFREFIRNFSINNVFIYRDAICRQWSSGQCYLQVDVLHVSEFNRSLYNSLQNNPGDFLPQFELGAKEALKTLVTSEQANIIDEEKPEFQIMLKSMQSGQSIRSLLAEHVNKLVKVPGIVISCSRVRSKVTEVSLKCSECGHEKTIQCKSMMGGFQIPNHCEQGAQAGIEGKKCPPGSYVVNPNRSEYIDQQTLKLQEAPEVVPTGEMPRSIMLSVDRYLVDHVTPGTRVGIVGISSLMNSGERAKTGSSSIRTSYLRVVGIHVESEGGGRSTNYFTPAEEEEMQALARDPNIYIKLANSIAPQIQGEYTEDIKKALACLLMGGSRKTLPEGLRLRGDINVLLMGDPSTAKSQFLKFIERVAPVGVYTSGKGSSAAGLTASVVKDSKGEFFLEGGAMVLADGGVICIDEFDKMREADRVAIHEAMEQQTISIAKAGITTVLNSRAAVLAAANPIYGRYDDTKSVGDNIDLMTTILSRFDCIFIVRDIRDDERDRSIARHVLGVHINASSAAAARASTAAGYTNPTQENEVENGAIISVALLKRYVNYCRDRVAPRLNDEAAAVLSSQYVHIRNQVSQRVQALNDISTGGNPNAAATGKHQTNDAQVVPITVRQLEALVRLSESLAKMRLSAEATVADVEEALRLFKVSTLAASQSNSTIMVSITGGLGANINNGGQQEIIRAEEFLKRRMGIRMTVNAKNLIEEALVHGLSNEAINRALSAMVLRNEIIELNQRKILKRVR